MYYIKNVSNATFWEINMYDYLFAKLVFHNSLIILFELKKVVRRLFWKRRIKKFISKTFKLNDIYFKATFLERIPFTKYIIVNRRIVVYFG
jgi:hypothetical protein